MFPYSIQRCTNESDVIGFMQFQKVGDYLLLLPKRETISVIKASCEWRSVSKLRTYFDYYLPLQQRISHISKISSDSQNTPNSITKIPSSFVIGWIVSILQDLLNLLFGLGNMSDQTEDFTLVLDPVVDEAFQSVSTVILSSEP